MRRLLENDKSNIVIYMVINILILADLVMIAYILWFNPSSNLANFIFIFDVILCLILLLNFLYKLHHTERKSTFIKHNGPFFVASIPFELVLPAYFMVFRFLLLLKLFKLSGLFEKYFESIHRFVENTKLDKLFIWIVFTVIVFTFAIYFLDPSLGLFDSMWYVIVTLTTVGYGDVTPNTIHAKIASIFLLVLGICIFSILTGAISSYFSDKILNIRSDTEEELDTLDNKIEEITSQLNDITRELELARAENRQLHEKLDGLLKK